VQEITNKAKQNAKTRVMQRIFHEMT